MNALGQGCDRSFNRLFGILTLGAGRHRKWRFAPPRFLGAFPYIIFLSRPGCRARLHPLAMNASMMPTDGVSRSRTRMRLERMRL